MPSDNTPTSILTDAYYDAGLLPQGETLTSEQLTTGMRKLTDLINLWQTQGLKLWLNQDTAVTLTAGVSLYTFGPSGTVVMPKPLKVIDAYYSDAAGNRRPIFPISRSDYDRLSRVSQQGQIVQYFVDKQATTLNVIFWNTPDTVAATGQVHLVFQRQVTNFTAASDTMDFPIEWRIALRWGVADEICTGQPQAIMDRCQQRALAYRTALEDWDVEDAPVMFTVDNRGLSTGAFR